MDKDLSEKFKDKKFRKTLLIYLIIFIVVVFLLNWFIKAQQSNRQQTETANFSKYYQDLLARCDQTDKNLYDCCFSSVEFMAANNYKLASGIGCDPGYEINTYKCLGSFKWCEMYR